MQGVAGSSPVSPIVKSTLRLILFLGIGDNDMCSSERMIRFDGHYLFFVQKL